MYYRNTVFRPIIPSQVIYPTNPSAQPYFSQPIQPPLAPSNIPQETHYEKIQKFPTSPSEMNINISEPANNLSESICQRRLWRILLGFILCLLVAAAIAIPLVILNNLIATTTTTTTTTSTTTVTTTKTTTTTTTAGTTVCSTTVITTTITSSALPSQCSSATVITDNTRKAGYTVAGSVCDQSGALASTGWYRFSGASGTMLANCAVPINQCGTQATGWYSGVYPSTAGGTTTGTVCYNWGSNTCTWSNSIQITNCNGYYVFYLSAPPVCNLRYCTI